jgi:hypothetical protein
MATLAREDDVAFADQRLVARLGAVRADWQNLKTSCVDTLTKPALIIGVVVAAAFWGSRSPSPPKPAECDCASGKVAPLFSRTLILAVVGPLLKDAIARGFTYFRGESTSATGADASAHTRGATAATLGK